jgi:hypothetical protein
MKTAKSTGRRNTKKRPPKPKAARKAPTTFASSFLPLMRCSRDVNACPTSGSIVMVFPGVEAHTCIVCGRTLRIRGQRDRSGQLLGRIPSHRRADFEERDRARARTQRIRQRFDQAEKAAREALARGAWNRAGQAILRARAIGGELPGEPQIERRLHSLDNRLLGAHANADRARSAMPKNPRRLLRAIVQASGVDLTAVKRTGWVEHLSTVLPKQKIASLGDQLGASWVQQGIVELLREAAPRNWKDLERRRFAGHRSVMAFIRKYPGLEGLRLPEPVEQEI